MTILSKRKKKYLLLLLKKEDAYKLFRKKSFTILNKKERILVDFY